MLRWDDRVLKDGIGEFGKLFFIKRFASSFDSHPKTWKMVSCLKHSNHASLGLIQGDRSVKDFQPWDASSNYVLRWCRPSYSCRLLQVKFIHCNTTRLTPNPSWKYVQSGAREHMASKSHDVYQAFCCK